MTGARRLGSIDRFEGRKAVLIVDGVEQRMNRRTLPAEAREGDVVDLETLTLVPEEREKLEARVKNAREQSNTPGSGNFDL